MAQRLAVAALLALSALALHLMLARQLERAGVFEYRNVIFDADIRTRLGALAKGRHLGLKYPNLMPYFSPPIAGVAKGILAWGWRLSCTRSTGSSPRSSWSPG